jgi:hypothetical protein
MPTALIRLNPPPETADEIFLVSHAVSRQRPAVIAVLAALRKAVRTHRAMLEWPRPATRAIAADYRRSRQDFTNHIFTAAGA